jgi:hypothetical protein
MQDVELVNFALSKMEYVVARGTAGREVQYEFDTLCKAYQVLSGAEYVPKKGKKSYGRSGSSVGSGGGSKASNKPGATVEEKEEPEEEEIPGNECSETVVSSSLS